MTTLEKPTVTVGTLVDGEYVAWCWHQSLSAMEAYDRAHSQHITTVAHVRASSGGLAKARNRMVEGFLSGTEEYLLILDSDHGFKPWTLDRLLEVADPQDFPVVGALTFGISLDHPDGYYGYRPETRLVAYHWDGTGFQRFLQYPEDAVWPVSATGAGCLLVHRSVLEKVGQHWFSPLHDRRGVELSEDLSFMLRLQELDIPVHIHTGVKTTHHKPTWISDLDYVPPIK